MFREKAGLFPVPKPEQEYDEEEKKGNGKLYSPGLIDRYTLQQKFDQLDVSVDIWYIDQQQRVHLLWAERDFCIAPFYSLVHASLPELTQIIDATVQRALIHNQYSATLLLRDALTTENLEAKNYYLRQFAVLFQLPDDVETLVQLSYQHKKKRVV